MGVRLLRDAGIEVAIITGENSQAVARRAEKLKINVLQGVSNKSDHLMKLISKEGYSLENILYVGNDLNDYHVMQLCGYSVCPFDSHLKMAFNETFSLGKGVVF